MEVYRFEECLGDRFSPISTFFSLVSSRALRDTPHSRFRCRDPNQFLPNFLKMLLYPPPNLHTCISHVKGYRFGQCLGWRFSPILTFFSVLSSCAFTVTPHSRYSCGDPHQCLPNILKMLLLPQIYTRVFHLWKAIDLNSSWVTDSRPHRLSFLL